MRWTSDSSETWARSAGCGSERRRQVDQLPTLGTELEHLHPHERRCPSGARRGPGSRRGREPCLSSQRWSGSRNDARRGAAARRDTRRLAARSARAARRRSPRRRAGAGRLRRAGRAGHEPRVRARRCSAPGAAGRGTPRGACAVRGSATAVRVAGPGRGAARRLGRTVGFGVRSGAARPATVAAAGRIGCLTSLSFRAARRCADFDRGFAATSPGVGATARRVRSSASGS